MYRNTSYIAVSRGRVRFGTSRVARHRLSIPLFLTNQYHSVKCIIDLDSVPVLVAGAQRSLLLLSTPATTVLPYANA